MINQLSTSQNSRFRFGFLLAAVLTFGIAAAAQACESPQVAGVKGNSNGTPCGQQSGGGGKIPPGPINGHGSYNSGLGSNNNGPFGNGGGTITVPGGGGPCYGAEFRCYSPK
jgi:hypothetical protein